MTNRLIQSQSLYLRKHAENPIDWWFWCEEALETAHQQNKPIFLSIGYSSCHWCTVMEGEAFSDRAIAEYMNANFIPIKVDREERPDLDSIYMQALQMMTGQGGWPLNIFLTPEDRVPFYGGTYFPIEPRYNRPGFLQVLQAIRRYYDQEKIKLQEFKVEIISSLQQAALLGITESTHQEIKIEQWKRGLEVNIGAIAVEEGGPNFPMIPYAEVSLRASRFLPGSRWGEKPFKYDPQQVSKKRGLALALGGIYDHVAGGFHRYTVDENWTVPHFEKMLYDNGQILEYLANLWSTGYHEPALERAVLGTVQWLKREMTSPQGFFYAAQDADSFTQPTAKEPEEGAFYVWSYQELAQILNDAELTELQAQFTVTPHGNFENFNVLQRLHPGKLSENLEAILAQLFQVRYGTAPQDLLTFPPAYNSQEAKTRSWLGRIPTVTDPKMIVAWNSLMISGLARAYSVFGNREYLELAVNAANFILANQWQEKRFHRLNYDGHPAVLAQSEDYALFMKALLDLQQASLVNSDQSISGIHASFWLEKAIAIQAEFDQLLWNQELGGYYNNEDSQDLLVRERSYIDHATPAPNGVAIANLIRLAILTNDLKYLDQAQQGLQAFSSIINRSPQACPSLFTALDWYHHHYLVQTSSDAIAQLSRNYLPTAILALETNLPKDTVGLVCQGLTCQEPALSYEQLWEQVQKISNL